MPLGGPGPRDWSPPGYFADAPSGPPPRRPQMGLLTAEPARRGRETRPWAWATLAMLLGLGSLVMALVEPQQAGIQTGFVASTIGITAIVIGRRLVTDRSRYGNISRAFGRGAVMLGSVGTALMAYAVLAFGLSTAGVEWPAISLPVMSQSTTSGDFMPAAVATTSPAPAPAVGAPADLPAADQAAPAEAVVPQAPSMPEPTTLEAERSAVAMGAGTLASVLEQRFGPGAYPTDLATTTSSPAKVTLLDGTGLAPVPAGARVLYSVSADRTAWSVTIIGARFGATATYSSAIGTVQTG